MVITDILAICITFLWVANDVGPITFPFSHFWEEVLVFSEDTFYLDLAVCQVEVEQPPRIYGGHRSSTWTPDPGTFNARHPLCFLSGYFLSKLLEIKSFKK